MTATILAPARTVFFDSNDNPLSGGQVYMYVPPNTSTPKTTWKDALQTIPNSNPIILDANGSCLLYGSGQYLQFLYDSLGNLIWSGLTQDIYGLIINGNNIFTGTNTFTGPTSFSGVINLADGSTAVTQPLGDDTTKVATDQFVTDSIARVTRTKLTTSTTYFVATTGSDSNTGTFASPWLTIQHAINTIQNTLDLAGVTVTIQVADGTYGAFIFSATPIGGNGASIIVNGNSMTPSNVVISGSGTACIICEDGALGATIQNLQITNSVGSGIFVTSGQIGLGNGIIFGACSMSHMAAFENSVISLESSYTINGNAQIHYQVVNGGLIDVNAPITITLTGTLAFSNAFALLQGGGSNLYFENIGGVAVFSGSATGVRYLATTNAVINTQASGSTYLPGNSGGSVASGGQYV